MKKILPLLAALFFAHLSYAQEIFDMPGATGTYLTGINDSGEICGYYTTASATIGFEINLYGDTIIFTGPGSGNSYVTANGINNKGLVVGNYGSNSNVAAAQGYVFYPNPGRNAGGNCVNVTTGWGGTNIQAWGIADDTCVAGSFQNGLTQDGALWCQGYTQENDLVCYNQSTRYPTYGFAVDKNSNVGGFIIEGAQEQCAIYRIATTSWDTFMVGGFLKSRIYGMNDNGWICGNYNSETKGFFARKLAGQALSNLTQIKVAGAVTIYPSDINNKNNVVGYYSDASGKVHGFIIATYDIGFRPSVNGWSCNNGNCAWPPGYYANLSYATDPFTGDTFPRAQNGGPISNQCYTTWPDFVNALPGTTFYPIKNGKKVLDYNMFLKWAAVANLPFNGSCYGFAIGAGLLFDRPDAFRTMFPNLNLYSALNVVNYPINDTTLQAVHRVFAKQNSKEYLAIKTARLAQNISFNTKLIMQELRNSRGRPHQGLSMQNQGAGGGGHALFPYKLVMDQGGNGIDTIYIYDCNYPSSDAQYISVSLNSGLGTWHYYGFGPDWGGATGKGFAPYGPDTIALSPTLHVWGLNHSTDNPVTRSVNDSIVAMYNDSSIVQMVDDSGSVAIFSLDTTASTDLILPITNWGGGMSPEENREVYSTNGVTTVSKKNHPGYSNNFLQITQDGYVIRCDRVSGTDTTDNYTYGPGSLSYIDSGSTNHTVAFTVAVDADSNQYNYFITNLNVPVNNKATAATYGTNGMVLQNFGPATTYVIITEFVIDSVRYFSDTIHIGSNTQHIIQPHDTTYSGIYILVDTGMTGHYEDTIFIHSTVTDINKINAPNLTAWPVPSDDKLYISGPQGLINYTIVDIMGRTVASGEIDFGNGETRAFNLVNLSPGMYIIRGAGQNEKWDYMFMKQ